MNFMFLQIWTIIRPVFFLKTDSNGDKYNELISGDSSFIENWKKAIHGYLYGKVEDLDKFSKHHTILKKN